MPNKSIWKRISNPRETYTDGYGVQREVYEPGYVTIGRKIYNATNKFLNGPKEINGAPINASAGALEFFFDPSSVGKLDDVAKLAQHLDKFKMDELRRFKLRRRVNQRPEAKKRIFRNADRHFPNKNDFYDIESNINYVENRIDGNDSQYMDILWRRGDLDGVKHPKVNYTYEDLPF